MTETAAPALAMVALLAAGCALIPGSPSGPKKVAKLSDDMAASLFRYQFAHNASALKDSAALYCIGYGANPGSDVVYGPSPHLVHLLADIKPRVAPNTACAIDPARRVVDKSSGGASLLFKIATVSCSSLDTCIVHAGYYENALSANSTAYFLKKRGRGWVVAGERDDWVS